MPSAINLRATIGVASFPAVNGANPYQRLLYQHLERHDIRLVPDAHFKLGWLGANRRNASFLHFHWPQTYYVWGGSPARLRTALSAVKLGLFAVRLAAARLLGYHIAWTVHQVFPHEETHLRLDRLAARCLARAAHVLLAHDEETAARARSRLGRAAADVQVVPHGSYIGVYPDKGNRAAVRAELGVAEDCYVFLYFGQIRGYKDLATLLDSFARVPSDTVRLVIAGNPADAAAAEPVREAARRDPRIVMQLGFVPEDRVAGLFAAADAVVLPRADGGTSGSLILALSLGRPVVAAAMPTYVELLGGDRAGWTFDAGDSDSLTKTLVSAAAASHEEAAARGAAGREIAAALTWENTADLTASLLRRARRLPSERSDVLLVCSAGGHLLQMLALRPAWDDFSRCWVTLDRSDAVSLLRDESVVFAFGPTHRSIRNLVRNIGLAWRIIGVARPRLILTTGAALAVPFAWVGWLRGARLVYVESITRIEQPSLSCRLIAPVASRVYVQWPELRKAFPRARFVGAVISSR